MGETAGSRCRPNLLSLPPMPESLRRAARARTLFVTLALLAVAHPLHAQQPDRAPVLAMQIMRPFAVQVQATEVSPEIPNCSTVRVWHGRLAPTDASGKRVSGRLKYFDRYEGDGCAVMSGGKPIGQCRWGSQAEYDAVADVSAMEVPEDANGPTLGPLAAGKAADGWRMYRAQRLGRAGAPPAKRVLRPRLSLRVAMRAHSLRTNNSCLAADNGKAMNELLAGQWFPFPPFLLPVETETDRAIHHDLGGGNEIVTWARWRGDLKDVTDDDLLAPLPAPAKGGR